MIRKVAYKTRDSVVFDLRSVSEDGSTFSGYAVDWQSVNSYKEQFQPGCFAETLGTFKDGRSIPVCYEHDRFEPIGKYVEAREDERGLFVTAELFTAEDQYNDKAKRTACYLREGIVSGLSIGFRPVEEAYDSEAGQWNIYKAKLYEVSPTIALATLQHRLAGLQTCYAGVNYLVRQT